MIPDMYKLIKLYKYLCIHIYVYMHIQKTNSGQTCCYIHSKLHHQTLKSEEKIALLNE